jgi:hypothetical protein
LTFRDNTGCKFLLTFIDPASLAFALSRGQRCCYTIKGWEFLYHARLGFFTPYSIIFFVKVFRLSSTSFLLLIKLAELKSNWCSAGLIILKTDL